MTTCTHRVLRRAVRLVALSIVAATAATPASAQPVSDALAAFYRQTAANWVARNSAAIAEAFAPMVELDLGEGTTRGNYTKDQATNILAGSLRSVTPREGTAVVRMTPTSMTLRHHYTDASGQLKQNNLYFMVRPEGEGFSITAILR